MSKYLELLTEIKEIKNNNFNINTLRKIQLLSKKINYYYKKKEISKPELLNIYIKYKSLINNKQKDISINKELSKILPNIVHQEYKKIPTDLTIIDNDLTLLCNEYYDIPYITETKIINKINYNELTTLYDLRTFMNSYRNIYKDQENNMNNFNYFYDFYYPSNEKFNQNNITLQNLINNINELLKPYNNNKDTIEFNKETHEIVYTKNNSLKIFTNTTLKEIIISIFKNQDITFNLIAIGDWNEIYKFEITQKTNKDKPLTYITKETSPNIWNLNKELQQNNNKKLTKNR